MALLEEDVILCVLKEVFMYKVPPLTTAKGYKAADWNGQHFMSGSALMVSRGSDLFICLKDDKGQPMVECQITDKTVIPTTDSSRYFVLALKDPKGHTRFVGIGFSRESNLAADFTQTVGDHNRKQLQLKQLQIDATAGFSNLSLKEGETIKIKLKAAPEDADSPATTAPTPVASTGGALPPPPGGRFHRKRPSKDANSPITPSTAHIGNAPTPVNSGEWDFPTSPTSQSVSTHQPASAPRPSSSAHIKSAPTPANSADDWNPFLSAQTTASGPAFNPFFDGPAAPTQTPANPFFTPPATAPQSDWVKF